MKAARIGGCIINLDKVIDLEYDEDNYIVTVTYKHFYFFKKKQLIRGVLESEFDKVYTKWDEHIKTIVLYVN